MITRDEAALAIAMEAERQTERVALKFACAMVAGMDWGSEASAEIAFKLAESFQAVAEDRRKALLP